MWMYWTMKQKIYGSLGKINVEEMEQLSKTATLSEVFDILSKSNKRIILKSNWDIHVAGDEE